MSRCLSLEVWGASVRMYWRLVGGDRGRWQGLLELSWWVGGGTGLSVDEIGVATVGDLEARVTVRCQCPCGTV